VSLSERIRRAQAALKTLPGVNDTKETPAPIAQRKAGDYQGKVWVTRKRPFIDRMASAWLIKRFIDRDAVFDFVDEMDLDKIDKGAVPFDIREGNSPMQVISAPLRCLSGHSVPGTKPEKDIRDRPRS